MSAFLHEHHHIDALVHAALPTPSESFYVHHRSLKQTIPGRATPYPGFRIFTYDDRDELGRILLRANYDSLAARYGDSDEVDEAAIKAYRFRIPATFSPVDILKALGSYEYQCNETDGWYSSLAAAICNDLRSDVCRSLPGWEESDAWTIHDEGRPNVVSLYDLAKKR